MPKSENKPIRLIVLDAMKPHRPDIVEFGKSISLANGIENLDVTVYAVDEKTESVKVVVEGSSLDFDTIKQVIEDFGAVIHSVDKVCIGKKICAYQPKDILHKL